MYMWGLDYVLLSLVFNGLKRLCCPVIDPGLGPEIVNVNNWILLLISQFFVHMLNFIRSRACSAHMQYWHIKG